MPSQAPMRSQVASPVEHVNQNGDGMQRAMAVSCDDGSQQSPSDQTQDIVPPKLQQVRGTL